jgi:hypothetical protein
MNQLELSKPSLFPHEPAVYVVLNRLHGTFYIGGTEDLYKRVQNHRTRILKGRHTSVWNYQPFEDFIVNFWTCSVGDLQGAEQALLDELSDNPKCKNVASVARYPGVNARLGRMKYFQDYEHRTKQALYCSGGRVFTLRDGCGNEYEVTNINQFCKEHDLTQGCLCRVVNGKLSQHRGYLLVKTEQIELN